MGMIWRGERFVLVRTSLICVPTFSVSGDTTMACSIVLVFVFAYLW
jgi:hypothetical protein